MTTHLEYKDTQAILQAANHILIIQAENPDGDSLGSALALEAIFSEMGKKTTLHCTVEIPKYLRYFKGWDRVTDNIPADFDVSVIVDTASSALLERTLAPPHGSRIANKPVVVLDHHVTESDLPFATTSVVDKTAVATGELIYFMAKELKWPLPTDACEHLVASILADSLGLSTEGTTSRSITAVAELVGKGAKISDIENRRREFMKKSPEILTYKGVLLQRVEYLINGALAIIHIPWDEIHEYSDQYNPSVLVLDEMRLVEGVRIGVALKSYPDGKITGKIRANPDAKIAEIVAGYFGGGGHPYAAGFKIYGDTIEHVKTELISAVSDALESYDSDNMVQ